MQHILNHGAPDILRLSSVPAQARVVQKLKFLFPERKTFFFRLYCRKKKKLRGSTRKKNTPDHAHIIAVKNLAVSNSNPLHTVRCGAVRVQHSPEQLQDDVRVAEHPVDRLEGEHGRPGDAARVTPAVDGSKADRPVSLALAPSSFVVSFGLAWHGMAWRGVALGGVA